MCLHEFFEQNVRVSPEKPAVICGHECLTYRELDRAATTLATRLQAKGLGPKGIVGLYLDRSIEMIVSMLAVLKAGGAYLPLDPAHPAPRLSFMLQDSEANVLLTQSKLAPSAPTGAKQAILVNLSELMQSPVETMEPKGSTDDLAYVIYTSGSTGKPKGVMIEHRSIVNYISAVIGAYNVRPQDRVLQLSSLSFDASVEEIFIALCSGATLVLRDDEMISSVAGFLEKCLRFRISVVGCPTAFWHELVTCIEQEELTIPPTLRAVIIGGEQASADRVKQWLKQTGGRVRLFNTYGPTETTIAATMFTVPENWKGDHVPIGVPIRGTYVRVLNQEGQPVGPGEEGELFLGGAGVARGYLKRPELSAEKFIADPFGEPGQRLYKTGDRVRLLPDQNLMFLGRIDQQVKIGGFRVEIGEVELALERHPNIRQAAVVVREDKPGEKQLAAYAIATAGTKPEELREFLAKSLPNYMVPLHFIFLEKFPLTPNGKVDRAALPAPSAIRPALQTREWKPRNPIELQLQVTFARFFNRTDIGPETSFFELGGNSLQALRIIVEVEKAVGKKLPLGILFKAATIKELAEAIAKEGDGNEPSALVPLQTGGSRVPLFLVHTTPGDVLGYGNLVYNLDPDQPCYGFQSVGLLNPDQAHSSIEEMARHYVQRMRSVQPQGPYHLAGWCYGGIVAMEMAQQLQLLGESVAFLGLIETPAPPPVDQRLRYDLERIGTAMQRSPGALLKYLGAKVKYYRTRNQAYDLRFKTVEERWDQREEEDYYQKLEFLYNLNLDAVNKYRSRPYAGSVVLFNAAERDPSIFPDPYFGWGSLVQDIKLHTVPGKHDTILMEPHVHELARLFESYMPDGSLNQAREPRPVADSAAVLSGANVWLALHSMFESMPPVI